MDPVRVYNMTKLFNRELFIYSFFDIKLKKPARISFIIYFLLIGVLFSFPVLYYFGFNPYSATISAIIPFAAASAMSKPIWGGKKFFDFMKGQIQYIFEPKWFYDGYIGKKLVDYTIDSVFFVSRRRDYSKLLQLERGRHKRW